MTFLSILYTLIIKPLELLFEVIFSIANRLIGNAGLSIIFLSLAVNFLVLPLYKRADELQDEEREIQAKMASRLKHIKSTFKGDERFFMVQEYYRINHYKPVYALKSSVSVLLQIPFFVAAYNLLSGMQSLQGMRFGFIPDLGKEDALFMIGNFPVNVLPILMTLINVVSGIIYTKGHPVKEKIQVYGLAAVFLVLLYRSPSGLVFYWLLNNVFSLVKNVFYKLKDPKKALNIILAIAGLAVIVSTLIRTDLDVRQKVLLSAGGVLLALPLLSGFIRKKDKKASKTIIKADTVIFFAGTLLMAMLTGLLIPATVIDSSAQEFIDVINPSNPVIYVINSTFLALGSWVLWGGVFYFFMNDKLKALFCKAIWIICAVTVADYMLFGRNLGVMSSTLQYNLTPSFKVSDYLINALAITGITAVFLFIYLKLQKIIKPVLIVGILTVFMASLMPVLGILGTYTWYKNLSNPSTEMPSIPLSRNGKNVIVLMLDRAVGTQLPYIFNEKPELKEKFDGFTYYPNTISYGPQTNFGAPALYGGYDYTPEKINERASECLESKHDEALKVMPVIFANEGYKITICDPSYAGYKWIPDLSIYSDYPSFNCYITNGRFNYFEGEGSSSIEMSNRVNSLRNRNFFMFSLMKISPVILQETIYNGGLYNETSGNKGNLYVSSIVQKKDGISIGTGYDKVFLESYTVLTKLPQITNITDSSENTFLMMTNETTHSPCLLQEPDYTPALHVDNTKYDSDMISRYTINGVTMQMVNDHQVAHYHVNIASYIKLGEWFDYLRANGVYDNTRIIIVSDHGNDLEQFKLYCNGTDLESFMPLLMFKDFGAKGFTVNEDFMTNGDTPTLASSGLIKNPVNPFTGHPIDSHEKNGPQTVFYSRNINIEINNGNTFLPGSWFVMNGNPHDPNNWKYVGDH
jgi:YidC/Oxa1 family membrane protein insertase